MNTIGALAGEPGRRWIASLPGLVEALCADWSLTIDGAPMHGFVALAVPVLRGDERCVLKTSWMDSETEHEGLALSIWDGRGAVRLLAEDPARGALLLERLDHTRSLHAAPAAEAVEVAGGLLRRLAVPAPPPVRSCRDYALRQAGELPAANAALGGPVPARLLDAALACARELGESADTALLLSQDLHYDNVLRGEREPWLMIDPKPISGDPEFGVIPLLWNRFNELDGERGLRERLAALVDAAELDPERARAWTLLRAVDNWLWELNAADPRQAQVCATIAVLLR